MTDASPSLVRMAKSERTETEVRARRVAKTIVDALIASPNISPEYRDALAQVAKENGL